MIKLHHRFLSVLVVAWTFGAPGAVTNLWNIGVPDGTALEFAHGTRPALTFTIGQSVPSRDFAGFQDGSIRFNPAENGERPYTVVFDLAPPIAADYELAIDLVFVSAAPSQLKIKVNDKSGCFPIRPQPMHSKDGEQGNDMLLAKQRLVVPLKGSWLREKTNAISIIPIGMGSMAYDALALTQGKSSASPDLRLEPTIFFKNRNGRLMELCQVTVPFSTRFTAGSASIRLGSHTVNHTFTNAGFDFGLLTETVEVPAVRDKITAAIELALDESKQSRSHEFVPAKQWKVFVCPKVHNDVGYTDLQPHVNELDNRNTDTVLDILDKYPFYKFNFEASWLVDNYLNCRTQPSRDRFLKHAKDGRASINALYLNLMTGLCTGEELHRALYFTHRLHREHHSNFDFACITDAPSHSWFLPTLLAGSGVKAFSNGSNQTRAPILHHSDLNEDSPFYWEGMNGERIFMWYARSYVQLKRLTGPDFVSTVSNFEYLKQSVPQFLVRYLRDNYAPDAVMIYGAYVDNAAIPTTGEAPAIEQWNNEFEYPKLVVASDGDYFRYIEKNFAGRLPVYRGDAGAYWEDGVGSTAQASALNRRTQVILPAAETAASLGSMFEAKNRYPAEEFHRAWNNVMFYNEHTWGAHNSISQPDREFVTRQWEIKESYATRANLDARNLLAQGCNRFAQQIAVEGNNVIAFNWQPQVRSAMLEVELDHNHHLVDLVANKAVPVDVLVEKDGYRRVRFVAEDVPAFGYKTFAVRWGEPPKEAERTKAEVIESPFYRLAVNPKTGAIQSLFDKTNNRELADTNAPYQLNQYLYVSGGENSLILNHRFGTAPATLHIESTATSEIVENIKTPLGQRLIVLTKARNTPALRTEYFLHRETARLDIVNTVDKEETRAKEAIYFAFPFAASKPAFEYQIQNGWCRPNIDQLPGACREWFAVQNLVHLRDENFSVAFATPDAPLVTLTDINRGKWLDFLPIDNGHVYSYVMNNYWFTNYRAQQGGRFVFRYSITSGSNLSRESLSRFDADTREPVFAYPFFSSFSAQIAQTGRPLPAASASLMSIDAPNLQFVTLKQAEDERGYVLRLRETSGLKGQARLSSSLKITSAHLANGVEESQQEIRVEGDRLEFPFKPNEFLTLRLHFAEGAK